MTAESKPSGVHISTAMRPSGVDATWLCPTCGRKRSDLEIVQNPVLATCVGDAPLAPGPQGLRAEDGR